MDADPTFLVALAAMACASFACRMAGYLLMGYVTITPKVEAALRSIPLGVMVGIVAPTVASGRLPEMAGLVVVGVVMKLVRNDLAAALGGAAVVAGLRGVGF